MFVLIYFCLVFVTLQNFIIFLEVGGLLGIHFLVYLLYMKEHRRVLNAIGL